MLFYVAGGAFACGGVDSDLFSGLALDGGDDVTDASPDARTISRDAGKSDASIVIDDDGGSTKIDSGGPPPGVILPAVCGTTLSCTSADPTCCATQTNDGITASSTYSCTSSPSTCNATGDAPVTCRDNRDCGGQQCCGELFDPSANGGYKFVGCESSCVAQDDAGLTSHVPFCTIGQTPDVCARYGMTCMASVLLSGFSVCGQD